MQNSSIGESVDADNQLVNQPFRILRWILCFPTAILACLVGRFILLLFNLNGMARYDGVEPGSFMWRLYEAAFGGLAMGGIFVFVASFIAPTHQRQIAIVSAALVLIVAGFGLFPSIMDVNLWGICEVTFLAIGASVAAYYFYYDD